MVELKTISVKDIDIVTSVNKTEARNQLEKEKKNAKQSCLNYRSTSDSPYLMNI